MPQYSIVRTSFSDKNCVVDPDEVYARNAFQLAFGEPAGPKYPDDLRLPMSSKSPGKATPDALHNSMRFLLASQRLTEILRRELTEEVEYLPFTLVNHKQKPVPGYGFIVNLIGVVDCVDAAATQGRASAMKPELLMNIKVLGLDAQRIPKDKRLFRIKAKPDVLIVRDDLRATLESEKVTGLVYYELGKPLPLMAL
jgi:hypothetical protein